MSYLPLNDWFHRQKNAHKALKSARISELREQSAEASFAEFLSLWYFGTRKKDDSATATLGIA